MKNLEIKFTEKQLEVLYFKLVEGFNLKEMRNVLYRSEGTIRVCWHRILYKVKRAYEKK